MAKFATENINLIEAFNREKYTNAELLLGPLMQNNDFLRVAAVLPANHGSIHDTLIADTVPSGKVRRAHEAVAKLAGKTHIKSDPVVSFEGDSEVDEQILDGSPDPVKTRMSEDSICLCGFSNSWNKLLIDGAGATAGGFDGLQARRAKLSNAQVISLGGTGSALTSAYLCEFGEAALALRYMQGGVPGFQTRDNGRVKADADDGGYYWAWSTHYQIRFGISLRQERALWRLCNINPAASAGQTIFEKIIQAKNKMPSKGRGAFLFVNTDVQSMLEIETLNLSSNVRTVEIENYGPVTYFGGVAILSMDAISSAESEVK